MTAWLLAACGGAQEAPGGSSRLGAVAAAAHSAQIPSATVDQLFNWAERTYPDLFPGRTVTARFGPYLYRYYAGSDLYIAVREGMVYALGTTITGGNIVPLGALQDYAQAVLAGAPQPLPVLRSSYENKILAGERLGPVARPAPELPAPYERITGAIAFADFFQEGELSAVAFSAREDEGSISGAEPLWTAGRIYFYRLIDGAWRDSTASILADTTGCIGTGRLVVADFNGDRRPDLFASCSGHDAAVNGKLPGEHPRILMSRADGGYDNVEFPLICFCSGTAADFTGDGYADIVLNDARDEGMLYYANNRDGTFTASRDRLPASTLWFGPPPPAGPFTHPIGTVELIDAYGTGRYDLFTGGADFACDCNYNWPTRLFANLGNDSWADSRAVTLPSIPGRSDIYDILVKDRQAYMLRWDWGGLPAAADDAMSIQKVNLDTLQSTLLFDQQGPFPDGLITTLLWLVFHAGQVTGVYDYPAVSVPL